MFLGSSNLTFDIFEDIKYSGEWSKFDLTEIGHLSCLELILSKLHSNLHEEFKINFL